MASNMQWLNDSAGNPLAAWVPGKGWVQPQNASYNVGGKLSGTNFAVDPEGGKSLSNQYYEKGRDAQLANGGQYILGSVGGSTDPFSKHVTSVDGLDLAGLNDQQKALFDPNSTWGSSGYDIWGSGTDSSVGAPSALYKKPPGEESFMSQFFGGSSDPNSAFGGKPWWGGSPASAVFGAFGALAGAASAAAAANAGAAGVGAAPVAEGAFGALNAGTSAIGGVEGAAALGGSATGAGGSALSFSDMLPNWLSQGLNSGGAGASNVLWDQVPGGVGAMGGSGAGITGAGAGTGGGMDWWDAFTNSVGDNAGTGFDGTMDGFQAPVGAGEQMGGLDVLRDLSQQPPPTNMQDFMTKLDKIPGGSALLNQLIKSAGNGASDAAGGGVAGAVSSAIGRLLSGNATSSDYASLLGRLAATGLGIYGANQQSNATTALANKYAEYGAPYRQRLADSYNDPNSFLANSPDIQASVRQGTDALARSLSRNGNPTGSGSALQELQNYSTQGLYGQLGNERNRLANFGGLSNFNAAAPGLAGQTIGAQGGALNALGSGISSITNPPTTLEQALNQINGLQGLKINSGTGF